MSLNAFPLSIDEIHRRRELTRLFMEERISREEVDELRSLLEREKAMAEQQGNEAIVVALGFLLGLVIGYLISKI
jgi:LPS O-antigen subunit length determinant protein (WzzB/FepE family)